ncbi:MAG: molybdopterin molybdotransferase MoeA [Desulfobacteraceae bacterium]|nr:molybdopterin molybdotransferase MoeA [Desulfobacteraceae bacterium]
MKEFFKVTPLDQVFEHINGFSMMPAETVEIADSLGRVTAEEIVADTDLPEFHRSTMDGFAVWSASTYGASEANPAYLTVKGTVSMGDVPGFAIKPGEAAKISTGGMLPQGADGIVMVEHTDVLDEHTIEVYKSVAPGQNMVEKGEDFKHGEVLLTCGKPIRPQEAGLLAAMGRTHALVYRQPVVGIISTGDEIVPVDSIPAPGQVRDVNSYTLSGQLAAAGAIPVSFGIVKDNAGDLISVCRKALGKCDMVFISGGSSVGLRDYTIDTLHALPDSRILVHGITISPGKPTILARCAGKPVWGLPGHVVSAMVVFAVVVKPFIHHLRGALPSMGTVRPIPAILSRNLSSVMGRIDYVRVRFREKEGQRYAEPVLGKSGLIHTMVEADGLIAVDMNSEGLDAGTTVSVMPF